mmetsp:Transcript_18135/g.45676  ORF Transcript_18135/g.45676 Transcript_18135/m.45676 type:complete len:729 (-) Transcript_18135:1324-3510(-)
MGAESSKQLAQEGPQSQAMDQARTQVARVKAIVGTKDRIDQRAKSMKHGARAVDGGDVEKVLGALNKLLLFNHLDKATQRRIVSDMYEKEVKAGEILIQQGDVGVSASQLYVVKSGKFEVLERRKNVTFRVNVKDTGDCFGEISLMYNCPRSATVAATTDAAVWVLDRDIFRHYVQAAAEEGIGQVELFMNSVPLLGNLTREQKLQLVDAFAEEVYEAGAHIIVEGDVGDKFFVIKEGEAVVVAGGKEVNRLFKSDFFGEQALLNDEPRKATVRAVGQLTVLSLDRATFTAVLGPLQDIMKQEKSAEAVNQRMAKLKPKGSAALRRPGAEVVIKTATPGRDGKNLVVAHGHLDEVQELRKGGTKIVELDGQAKDANTLVLAEGTVLGGGAFSRVSIVTEESTGRTYAMKRMRKSAVVQCPEHVFCEQAITKNVAHPFCIRQYASFQDTYHLYFLFDLMPGGDLMDVLVAEAKVIKYPVPEEGTLRKGCLAQKVKMWQGMSEDLARFYIGSIVLALEYLHNNNIVYRDLKPENLLLDAQGYIKVADFGFGKYIGEDKTYTICGTPDYQAPEVIMRRGTTKAADYWALGVLIFELLVGDPPFKSLTGDPWDTFRRTLSGRFYVPNFISDSAADLIFKLLQVNPEKRLGSGPAGAEDIKRHKWFSRLDWKALEERRLQAPIRPRIRNPLDTSNFDNFDACDVEAPPVPANRLERHAQLWDLWEWIDKPVDK